MYLLFRNIFRVRLWNKGIDIHKVEYTLRELENSEIITEKPIRLSDLQYIEARFIDTLIIPCRANLHKLLTYLYFEGDFKTENILVRKVSEEDFKYLRVIFNHQEDYRIWKKLLKVYQEKGKERTFEELSRQVALIKLREKL